MKQLKYLATAALSILLLITAAAGALGAETAAAATPVVSPIPAFLQATV